MNVPMRHLKTLLLTVLAAALWTEAVWAQRRKDRVVLQEKARTRRITGRVLAETWKSVKLDKDDDGVADETYEAERVRRIEYANRPRYILEAILLKREPRKLIVKLARAYVDNVTPKHILQHAYYDIAAAHARLARTDATELPKVLEAYGKLFGEIPDTRYAITGRIELGNLLLELGKGDEAIRQFEVLATGKFGPEIAQVAKLRVARAELALKRFDRAEKLLSELATSTKGTHPELSQEVKLLASRSMVGQKKFDEAYRSISGVLSEKPSRKILGMAYVVLGDLFAERGQHRTALTAYLKVSLMYPETDSVERSRAYKQAARMLEKLGRADQAKELRKQLEE